MTEQNFQTVGQADLTQLASTALGELLQLFLPVSLEANGHSRVAERSRGDRKILDA